MDPAELFKIANAVATLGWAFLILLPMWRGSQLIAAFLIPTLLSLAYAVLLGAALTGFGVTGTADVGGAPSGSIDFTTLEGVKGIFATDGSILVAWIHYLAFDLFVGAWEARDAKRRRIPHLILVPCLLLTFMFGPAGLFLYMIIRTVRLGIGAGKTV